MPVRRGAHGKESLEEDSCVRRIGENMVHLSAYQPQYDIGAQYCTEIPKGGDTYLVVDCRSSHARDAHWHARDQGNERKRRRDRQPGAPGLSP